MGYQFSHIRGQTGAKRQLSPNLPPLHRPPSHLYAVFVTSSSFDPILGWKMHIMHPGASSRDPAGHVKAYQGTTIPMGWDTGSHISKIHTSETANLPLFWPLLLLSHPFPLQMCIFQPGVTPGGHTGHISGTKRHTRQPKRVQNAGEICNWSLCKKPHNYTILSGCYTTVQGIKVGSTVMQPTTNHILHHSNTVPCTD